MEHSYCATIRWTGNLGQGTSHYKNYERSHTIEIAHKPTIAGSSDPSFRGDRGKHNPEDLFLSSLAACHMLWYLHLCATDGSGYFTQVTLSPVVAVTAPGMVEKATSLHQEAHRLCFIANSVKCPVYHTPQIRVASLA
jgi:organic hydroperoxide reductase OsmC/OhrA